jgi:hypothetical protein
VADDKILRRIDRHMERGNELMERIDAHIERGNELMAEVRAEMRLNRETMQEEMHLNREMQRSWRAVVSELARVVSGQTGVLERMEQRLAL